MKKIFISKLIFSCLLGLSFSSFADNNVWETDGKDPLIDVSEKSPLIGDAYWNGNSDDYQSKKVEFNRDSIYSDKVSKIKDKIKNDMTEVEANKIRTAALAYGAQTGYYVRGKQINDVLKSKTSYYDKVFNFSILQLEEGLLPPVISEGQDAYNQPSDNSVRAADKIYKIESPAKLVNTVPHWQEYLYVRYTKPELPNDSVLPTTSEQKTLWDQFVEMGWAKGVEQAENSFKSNVGRLNRDFNGMIRFKNLYERGLVTKPMVAKTELGVTGGGDEMAIGDRLIEITSKASLNPNEKTWLKNRKDKKDKK